MDIELHYLLPVALAIWATYIWSRPRSSISHIPGPPPEWFFGNIRHVMRRSNVDVMLDWQKQFGSVFRVKGLLGLNKLIVADPKALQHILNTSAYEFPKPEQLRKFLFALNGSNLVWAEGEFHKKQRRIISPAFGVRETKALLPVFKLYAEKLVEQWKDMLVDTGGKESSIIDVHHSIHFITLDALCEAAFDFQTGDKNGAVLRQLYGHFNEEVFPPNAAILNGIMDHLPPWILPPLLQILPLKTFAFIRKHKQQTYEIAKELATEKTLAISEGQGKKDVFSLLVQANISEHVKNLRLTDEELYAQTSLLFIAGHDTTASTMTFALWQLANHVDVQTRLRNEIREAQATARARGRTELAVDDMENMSYLQAILKEALRLHPTVFQVPRSAAKDCILPLSRPIKTTSGEMIEQIAVPKGTEIVVAIGCYNRDKDIWGDDAHEFNPDRWLTGEQATKQGTSVGVLGNLMTFLSGTKSCIGWRFAMVQMQTFLVEIIDQLEIRADPTKKARAWGDNLVFPLVDGEEDQGAQMPLCVSIAARE